MEKLFFDSWESTLRTFIIGITAYVGLILLLRISGKRTLSKMNSFDFIVTIALGSTLATVLLNKNVALIDGLLGFALLIYLQFLVTYLSVRSEKVEKVVKSSPALLFYKGKFLNEVMKSQRVTREEVLAAIRQSGMGDIDQVGAVVLENNGKLSVLKNLKEQNSMILTPVSYAEDYTSVGNK